MDGLEEGVLGLDTSHRRALSYATCQPCGVIVLLEDQGIHGGGSGSIPGLWEVSYSYHALVQVLPHHPLQQLK